MQLRFGAGLQSDVVFVAVTNYFGNHGLHLVHLDGVDDEVLAVVAVFVGRVPEAVRDLADTVVKNIGETKQQRGLYVAQLQRVHHLLQVDGRASLLGRDLHMSLVVD